ncbi:MAG: hypothetical protein HC851_19165 [Acaryochloris sp. RU_4_1]|nr:hypothetical protein [Acaryochloris sp. RU_4_1]NJR55655.1 hypothetical protein [Acaryochloris sp. CRU_2_0]
MTTTTVTSNAQQNQSIEDMQAEELVLMKVEQIQLEKALISDFANRLRERLAHPSSNRKSVHFSTEIIDTITDYDSSPSKSLKITLNGKFSLSEVATKRPCGFPGYNWTTPSEAEMQALIQDPRFKELLIFFSGKDYDFAFEQYPQFNLADSSSVDSLELSLRNEARRLLDEYEVVAEGDFWIATLHNFWVVQGDITPYKMGDFPWSEEGGTALGVQEPGEKGGLHHAHR